MLARLARSILHGFAAILVWASGGARLWCAGLTWTLGIALVPAYGGMGLILASTPAFAWGVWFGWNKETSPRPL